MKALIFDTETTGLLLPSTAPLHRQPQIIEIGALLVEGETVLDSMSQVLDPKTDVPAIITKITGLTNADVTGKPTFADWLPQLRPMFAKADTLICHNAPFDRGMLANELTRAECEDFPWPFTTICTVAEFMHVWGRRAKLTELYEHFVGEPLEQTHRALDDCRALHQMLIKSEFFTAIGG